MKTKFANSILRLTFVVMAISVCIVAAAPAGAESASSNGVVRTITIGGDGGWDYVFVDPTAHRAYIARSTRFQMVDLESLKLVGEIPDTLGAHGAVVVPDLGVGFT